MIMKYRLKDEAAPFYDKKLSNEIKSYEWFKNKHVHDNAIEKAPSIFISAGISEKIGSNYLQGWSSNDGEPSSHFYFTINFTEMEYEDYRSFDEEKTRKMVRHMECAIHDFINKTTPPGNGGNE